MSVISVTADAEAARALEELAGRRAQLGATIEDLSRRIRELGALPSDTFDKHRNKSNKVRCVGG